MRVTNMVINAYLLICIAFFTTGCIGWLIGRTPEQLTKEMDKDGDGKVTKEEVKKSGHDKDQDGVLSKEEMEAALAPNDYGNGLLILLSVLNLPWAIGLKKVISVATVHKENTYHLINRVQKIKDTILDGEPITRKKIGSIMNDGKLLYTNAEHLTEIVKDYKNSFQSRLNSFEP